MAGHIPDDLKDQLAELDPGELDSVSQQIKELADQKRQQEQAPKEESNKEGDGGERESVVDSQGDELPTDVPAKASLTVKIIDITSTTTGSGATGSKLSRNIKHRKSRRHVMRVYLLLALRPLSTAT